MFFESAYRVQILMSFNINIVLQGLEQPTEEEVSVPKQRLGRLLTFNLFQHDQENSNAVLVNTNQTWDSLNNIHVAGFEPTLANISSGLGGLIGL